MGIIYTGLRGSYVLVLTGTIFGVLETAVMSKKMDFSRDKNTRNGHPGENAPGERGRKVPLDGFEGMNFEQRREPYKSRRQDINHNRGNKQDPSHSTEEEGAA